MHAIFRFALAGAGERGYREAYALLAGAGFRRAAPGAIDAEAPFPAAVAGEVWRSPEDATRAIFEVLGEAGLRPVAVSGCAAPVAARAERGARA